MDSKFKGVYTALVTPFKNDKVDFSSLGRLIDLQIKDGVSGFVVFGTTGESPTLSKKEKDEIAKFVIDKVPEKIELIFGVGGNSTRDVVNEVIEFNEKYKPDGILSVVPYYNKPPQRGLIKHFLEISKASKAPIILYNVPGRTITALELDTIQTLSEDPNILGLKEASGNIDFDSEIRKKCSKSFSLLSGDDGTYDDFVKIGGNGIISVASHIIPKAFINVEAKKYISLIDSLYIESNPIPVKYALYKMGVIDSPDLRLPLVSLSEEKQKIINQQLTQFGLI